MYNYGLSFYIDVEMLLKSKDFINCMNYLHVEDEGEHLKSDLIIVSPIEPYKTNKLYIYLTTDNKGLMDIFKFNRYGDKLTEKEKEYITKHIYIFKIIDEIKKNILKETHRIVRQLNKISVYEYLLKN